jgi:hypothetical protein
MTPRTEPGFLAPRWCDSEWSPFVPFAVTRDPTIAAGPGLYRVRVAGREQLAYIGQTGRNLRERVGMLARGTLAAEMPFNDPHTAAPKLWSFRDAEGLAYEVSVTTCDLPKNDRMGLECFLVWRYRLEAGASPLCNFGRLHPRYATSANRSTGRRGRRLNDDEPDNGGPSVPALALSGTPDGLDWMGLSWSAWGPLTAVGLNGAPTGPGVYRIADDVGHVLYIGQSSALAERLRSHARSPDWPGPVSYSLVTLPGGYTPTQLLEVENDLIAGHVAATSHPPLRQFGREDTSAHRFARAAGG